MRWRIWTSTKNTSFVGDDTILNATKPKSNKQQPWISVDPICPLLQASTTHILSEMETTILCQGSQPIKCLALDRMSYEQEGQHEASMTHFLTEMGNTLS